jgi:hypothetical protein
LNPEVRDLGLALRREHLLHGFPDTGGRLDALDMRKDLWPDRLKEIAQNDLIAQYPRVVGWVRRSSRGLVFIFIGRWHLDCLRRCRVGAVEKTEQTRAADRGQNLGTPP